MTFAEFVTAVEATVFPEGVAENLVSNHRKYIIDGLIDLQQKVPCLQTRHRNSHDQSDVLFDCGATVFNAPRGFIQSFHTIPADDCCARVWYDPISPDQMRCYLSDQQLCGYKYRAYGFYLYGDEYYPYEYEDECQIYTDSGTDKPCRANHGWFSLVNGQIYVFPHLQSTELAVLEWDGIKRDWEDADTVEFDRETQEAIELYLEWKTKRREDADLSAAQAVRAEFEIKVGNLIWQCKKERRLPTREPCFSNCGSCLPRCD